MRIYSKPQATQKAYYEEDLFPGDMFCETSLSGRIDLRMIIAQALTQVDLIEIDDHSFLVSQEQNFLKLNIDDKLAFLTDGKTTPIYNYLPFIKFLSIFVLNLHFQFPFLEIGIIIN